MNQKQRKRKRGINWDKILPTVTNIEGETRIAEHEMVRELNEQTREYCARRISSSLED